MRGGKGANQAVAAARLGGKVTFVARIGEDLFGKEAREGFEQEGIDTQYIGADPESPSGVALILVNAEGENSISVAPGANGKLSPQDIDRGLPALREATFLLMQLEIPLDTVAYAVKKAEAAGVKVVLNPAPAKPLASELLAALYMITPNETECELLTGIKVQDEEERSKRCTSPPTRWGFSVVVITLGAMGGLCLRERN